MIANENSGRRFDGISIVVPFFQNEASIDDIYRRLKNILKSQGREYDFIFVNDGSRDDTQNKLHEIWRQDDRVTVLNFSRNFGQRAGWTAGLKEAEGAVVVTIDGDGQLDPEEIPKLLEAIEQGADVASGWRVERYDPLFRKAGSWLFNWSVRKLGQMKVKDFGCSLKAYSGYFLDQLNFGPHALYDKAAALSLTDAIVDIPVTHHPVPRSRWKVCDLLRYAVDVWIAFSNRYFLRFLLWSPAIILLSLITLVLSLSRVTLSYLIVPLLLFTLGLLTGLLSLVGLTSSRALRETEGRCCYIIKTRMGRRWRPEKNA